MRYMKTLSRLGAFWALVFILAATLSLSLADALRVDAGMDKISMRLRNTAGATAIDAMRESMADDEAGGSVTAWLQENSVQLSAEATGASATVEALYVDGDGRMAWDISMVYGNLPAGGAPYDAAIDAGTAMRLFGSTDVVGETITSGGQELHITGVFTLPSGLLSWGAQSGLGMAMIDVGGAVDTSYAFTHLTFLLPKAPIKVSADLASGYAQGAGLRAVDTVDARETELTMYEFAHLPLWILAVLAIVRLAVGLKNVALLTGRYALWQMRDKTGKHAGKHRKTLVSGGVALGLFAAVIVVILLAAEFDVRVPPAFLPTEWSDFSFWTSLVESAAQRHYTLAQFPITRPEAYERAITLYAYLLPPVALIALARAWASIGRAAEGATGKMQTGGIAFLLLTAASPLPCALLTWSLGVKPLVSACLVLLPAAAFSVRMLLTAFPPHWYALRALRFGKIKKFQTTYDVERGISSNEENL